MNKAPILIVITRTAREQRRHLAKVVLLSTGTLAAFVVAVLADSPLPHHFL